jgi:hypothetical protein
LSFAVHNVWHKGLKISVVCAHRHPWSVAGMSDLQT